MDLKIYLILQMCLFIIEISDFLGDLTDIAAERAWLITRAHDSRGARREVVYRLDLIHWSQAGNIFLPMYRLVHLHIYVHFFSFPPPQKVYFSVKVSNRLFVCF